MAASASGTFVGEHRLSDNVGGVKTFGAYESVHSEERAISF
jgi:hypothetical protein